MESWTWAEGASLSRGQAVLRSMLDDRASETPDRIFARFEDGSHWTYAETLTIARRAAAGFSSIGVAKGDSVLILLGNGPDFLKAWFGLNYIGAIVAAPNLALKGAVLQHLIQLTDARVAVVQGGLMERLAGLDLGSTRTILESGTTSGIDLPVDRRAASEILDFSGETPVPDVIVEPWDTQFIIFSSGTTGPSKGVIVTYVQMHDMVLATFGRYLGADDNYLLNMPLFHISGTRGVFGMLMLGGRFTLVAQFKTDIFWDVARAHGTTAAVLLGAAASFLEGVPERPDDADNPMRLIAMVPLVKDPSAFGRRFGVDVVTSYGMSELSIPLMSAVNPTNISSCGTLRPGYEARIVDADDIPVPPGATGQLILRAGRPWTISPGYWRMPEATAAAWRNGWFHTGDNFRVDADGNYYFVDRTNDAIRRRGENISSYEVEMELVAHPAVREAAAVAVSSDDGEDEVLAVVALHPNARLDPVELFEFLRPRMAHYMLPRFIRLLDELPKTPSMRVQKHVLRGQGVADCWDRVAAGIVVKRERIAA